MWDVIIRPSHGRDHSYRVENELAAYDMYEILMRTLDHRCVRYYGIQHRGIWIVKTNGN
jgi:hypothetical protein